MKYSVEAVKGSIYVLFSYEMQQYVVLENYI